MLSPSLSYSLTHIHTKNGFAPVHIAAKDGDVSTFTIMSDVAREAGLFDHMTSLTTSGVKTKQNEHTVILNYYISMCSLLTDMCEYSFEYIVFNQ
jgi:hypothetical protein